MAVAVLGNDAWKGDIELRENLEKYVKQNHKKKKYCRSFVPSRNRTLSLSMSWNYNIFKKTNTF